MWWFISTPGVPVEDDFIFFIGHQHLIDSRLEQNFLLIGRLFFYAFAGRDRGDGGRGIIPGRRAAQVGCAGLQVVAFLFQAAKVISQGSRGGGSVAGDEGHD